METLKKCPFKPGDKVVKLYDRSKTIHTVEHIPGMTEYDDQDFSDSENGMTLKNAGLGRWVHWNDYRLYKEQPAPAPESLVVPKEKITSLKGLSLEQLLKGYIDENRNDQEFIKTEINRQVAKFFGNGRQFTRELQITYPDKKSIQTINNPHENLDKLVYLVSSGRDCYLHGPAGTGKSTACKQVAELLGRPFAYASLCPQSSESLLFGFMHAGGQYVETELYKLYRDGGVFCLDEMDNGSASLLNKLNSLLENGHGSFPCGTIPRHKDFILVATGNTNGNGASLEFPDRRAFDPAFKERFAFLNWPLDQAQEKLIAISLNTERGLEWLEIVQKIRKAVIDLNIERVVVSPRATYRGCLELTNKKFSLSEIAEMFIFKGIDANITKSILEKAGVSL